MPQLSMPALLCRDPLSNHPRRIVPPMLIVTTSQLRDPVAVFVGVIPRNTLAHQSVIARLVRHADDSGTLRDLFNGVRLLLEIVSQYLLIANES